MLGLAACSGSAANDVPPVAYEGALPATVAARDLFDTFAVQATVDGAGPRTLLVDTGSPMTGVDPESWTDAHLATDFSTLSTVGVGSLTWEQVPAVSLTECGSTCGPFDPTGVLGGNVLRSFVLGFDYQAPAVLFGPRALPSDAQSTPTTASLDLAGGGMGTIAGGNGQQVDVPPTRLIVTVPVEGTNCTLIIDTGASYTLLRDALFQNIASDGRAVLTLGATTVTGGTQLQVVRTHTLGLSSATVTGSPIGDLPDAQAADLTSEVGRQIDGLLGGSYLRAYYTLVDYGGQKLSLYPYKSPDPLADEFDRVGVFLVSDGNGYVISQAVGATDPSLVGETLVDVDGSVVAGLDPDQADRLLRGAIGTSHVLHVQQGGAVVAVTLPVLDVLPLTQ